MTEWYEEWPERLIKEQHEMKRRYSEFTLFRDDNRLFWTGKLHTDRSDYEVMIIYPSDFPRSSPRVYPIFSQIPDQYLRTPHKYPDGSMCLYYPAFNSPFATAADIADAALLWLTGFESFVHTGQWQDPRAKLVELKESKGKEMLTATRVLVVFANPRGSDPLRLGEEDRTIRECLVRSKYRDRLIVNIFHAVRIKDFQRALIEEDYQIVHFSGHGVPSGQLAFEDEQGKAKLISQQALANLLSTFPSVQCVLLNACYSISQGQLIAMGVPVTIAMEGPISDHSAQHFTRGFYDSIGAGKDYQFAYKMGCNAIELEGYFEMRTPQILIKCDD